MKNDLIIYNAQIVNEGQEFHGAVTIRKGIITSVLKGEITKDAEAFTGASQTQDAQGAWLFPGCIDDQVHFREPGLTHKGDLFTESRAAAAGGITSFMEMPNTQPPTLTQDLLEEKYQRAAGKSLVNYSFFMGASNDNLAEIRRTDPTRVCGVKVFMGASTGNMLVDNPNTLEGIFAEAPCLVAVHAEEESIIRANLAAFTEKYGTEIPVSAHPQIRSAAACLQSTEKALGLATKYQTRLHVLHVSTAAEASLFSAGGRVEDKSITAEACVHHLWFDSKDYTRLGNLIKWNPAIKEEEDREALFQAVLQGKIDLVATDHAPHTWEEKQRPYMQAPSGGPLVQHALPAMLEFVLDGKMPVTTLVEKMCHAPARAYAIRARGFIREGYQADLVLVDRDAPWKVEPGNILYKCAWSPFLGNTFRSKVIQAFVNGNCVFNKGIFNDEVRGERLLFNR